MTETVRESRKRSLLKAVSWRVLATATTILIAWAVYRDIKPALAIGGIEFLAKFLVYYLGRESGSGARLAHLWRLHISFY